MTSTITHPSAGEARNRPSLGERADTLARSLELVEEGLGLLYTRLEPVLAPSLPRPTSQDTSDANKRPEGSWLTDFLTNQTERAHGIAGTIAALADRIDL
jgi:hypothetical protein